MLAVLERAVSALLLNIGHMLSDYTSLDLLTGESHFLSFTGQVSSSQCQQGRSCDLTIMCWSQISVLWAVRDRSRDEGWREVCGQSCSYLHLNAVSRLSACDRPQTTTFLQAWGLIFLNWEPHQLWNTLLWSKGEFKIYIYILNSQSVLWKLCAGMLHKANTKQFLPLSLVSVLLHL